ncbi:MAG: protein phosphatase 2C domain-containing protein [Phormidium sp.]
MAMTKFNLEVNIEVAEDRGEDANVTEYFGQTFLMGVFDGLGGVSAGYDGKTGGRIASEEASKITKTFFKQWHGQITSENAIQLQHEICESLKFKADNNMPKSRLKGTLLQHRLCTTIALASIKQQGQEKIFEANLAWMGDSRIYFLSPTKGLQQLTKDDLKTPKDALEILREDPPMSQCLTADIKPESQIHFQHYKIEESGCFLACTDGCFQYFSAPWEFEKLLLDTLAQSEGDKKDINNWQKLIIQRYTEIKQDDVSLILKAVGFNGIKHLKSAYQERWHDLQKEFISPTANTRYDDLQRLWAEYRNNYEYYLQFIQDIQPIADSKQQVIEDELSISATLASSTSSKDMFQKITQSSKQKVVAKAEEIKNLLEQANYCYKNSRLAEAKILCNQVEELIKNYPESPEKLLESLRNLAFIYYELNQREKAIQYYQHFFNIPGAEKLDHWEYDLEAFVNSLHLISNKNEPVNVAIQFCKLLITRNLPNQKKAEIYYFMAVLEEIGDQLKAANNSIYTAIKICSSSLDIEYKIASKMKQKYEYKYQEIHNKLKYRRY